MGMPAPGAAAEAPGTGDTISYITLLCRAVNLQNIVSDANTTIIYTMENELKASPMFDPAGTQLVGQINADDATGTFTFGVQVLLKVPLKL
jgi:hypothetical protein